MRAVRLIKCLSEKTGGVASPFKHRKYKGISDKTKLSNEGPSDHFRAPHVTKSAVSIGLGVGSVVSSRSADHKLSVYSL